MSANEKNLEVSQFLRYLKVKLTIKLWHEIMKYELLNTFQNTAFFTKDPLPTEEPLYIKQCLPLEI